MRDRETGLLISLVLLVCALATAANWQTVSSGTPHAELPKKALQSQGQEGKDELTLRGCLEGTEHLLTPERYYRLLGSTSELRPYNQRYVAILVKKPQKQPAPSGEITVEIIRLIGVLPRPRARLNASVRDFSRWTRHAISHYGLNFEVPDIFSAQNVPRVLQGSEFVNKKGTVQLADFRIPAETYSGASSNLGSSPARAFGGGSFALFANPEITDASFCSKFENPEPNSLLSSLIVRGIHYSEHRDDVVALGLGIPF